MNMVESKFHARWLLSEKEIL